MKVYTESESQKSVICMKNNISWPNSYKYMKMYWILIIWLKSALWFTPRILSMCFSDSVLGRASSGFKRKGQRIFVFIVGGATRSEVLKSPGLRNKFCYDPYAINGLIFDTFCVVQLRVCHKLTEKLDREVILGSSSFLDPQTFLTVWNLFTVHWTRWIFAHSNSLSLSLSND